MGKACCRVPRRKGAAGLLVLWVVLWLGFKIVSGVVHLLVIIGVVLLVWGLLKKGARAVGRRL